MANKKSGGVKSIDNKSDSNVMMGLDVKIGLPLSLVLEPGEKMDKKRMLQILLENSINYLQNIDAHDMGELLEGVGVSYVQEEWDNDPVGSKLYGNELRIMKQSEINALDEREKLQSTLKVVEKKRPSKKV